MFTKLALATVLLGVAAACDQKWPNGTDSTMHWWQCGGSVTFYNATPFDQSGKYEYPIHLTKPLIVKADMMTTRQYDDGESLRSTVDIWSWGGWAGCAWSEVPTLGLLKDLPACQNGVPCPVKKGRNTVPITLDFTKFEAIVKLLKDDIPYQLAYQLHDKSSGDSACIMAQARAYTKS